MRVLILIAVAIFANFTKAETEMSDTDLCRNAVVEAFAVLGNEIDPNSFSNAQFEDFNLTVEQFNSLESSRQVTIYNQIKPLPIMIEETISILTDSIDSVVGTFYEFFMSAELKSWRESREKLRSCNGGIRLKTLTNI